MLRHFLNLCVQTLSDMPSRVGSNWGGVVFSIALFVLAQAGVLMTVRGAWLQWKTHWEKNVWTGVVVVCVGWIGLFCISFVATVYDDHQNLVGAAKRFKINLQSERKTNQDILSKTRTELGNHVTSLETSCAVKDGVNETLQKQNRDQQSSINGCLSQAMKLLTPEELKVTGVPLEDDASNVMEKWSSWIVLTNKTITPVSLVVACTAIGEDGPSVSQMIPAFSLLRVDASVLGSGNLSSPNQRLARDAFRINIISPAWTKTTPMRIKVWYRGSTAIGCRFLPNG